VALEATGWLLLPRGSLQIEFERIRHRVEAMPPPKVQIVGDSVAGGGIMAGQFPAETGLRNDAIMGTTLAFTYFLLRDQLGRSDRVEDILFAHLPRAFEGTSMTTLVGLFADWSEMPEVLSHTEIWERKDVLYGLLTRFSYLLAYRTQLRELLTTGELPEFVVPGTGVPEAERLAEYRRQIAAGTYAPRPLPVTLPDAYRQSFTVSPKNDVYFRKLLDLARSNGVRVHWVALPVSERVARERDRLGFDRDLERYLERFTASGVLRILLDASPVYPDSAFDDLSHLSVPGSLMFTCHLREIWRDHGPGRGHAQPGSSGSGGPDLGRTRRRSDVPESCRALLPDDFPASAVRQ